MAVDIGLHTGPQDISMADLLRLWREADEAGFRWISVWDHFYSNPLRDRTEPCFEGVAIMAALAALTKRVQVGCLMFCALYRSPGLLAKAAVTIDHISGGRCNLGVGAGWFQEEFEDFGYRFPPIGERFEHLEEALHIIRSLLDGEVTDYEGKYYSVSGAVCGPRPVQEKLPIWIGGRGPVKTPTFAAKYADGFNVPYVSPEEYKQRLDVVERVCGETRRDPAEVRRTVNLGFYMGADEKSAERNKEKALRHPEDQRPGMLVGTAQQVMDRMNEFVAAGAQGINIATRPPVDWDAWHAFIETVLPHFHAK